MVAGDVVVAVGIAEAGRRAAVPRQHGNRLTLRGPVTPHEDPPLGISSPARRFVGGDQDPGIIEPDPASQLDPRRRPAAGRPDRTAIVVTVEKHRLVFSIEAHGGRVVEYELGSRSARFDPPACPTRQFEPGQIGQQRVVHTLRQFG